MSNAWVAAVALGSFVSWTSHFTGRQYIARHSFLPKNSRCTLDGLLARLYTGAVELFAKSLAYHNLEGEKVQDQNHIAHKFLEPV
jgi:hypothetical protein